MNIKEVILNDGNIGFGLEKRDAFYAYTHKLIFEEEFDPEKMVLGDVSVEYVATYFLGRYEHEGKSYSLFYDTGRKVPIIHAKDLDKVPTAVQDVMFGSFYREKMAEFNKIAEAAMAEKKAKEAKSE